MLNSDCVEVTGSHILVVDKPKMKSNFFLRHKALSAYAALPRLSSSFSPLPTRFLLNNTRPISSLFFQPLSNSRRAFSSSYLLWANPEPPGDPSKPDALPPASQTHVIRGSEEQARSLWRVLRRKWWGRKPRLEEITSVHVGRVNPAVLKQGMKGNVSMSLRKM